MVRGGLGLDSCTAAGGGREITGLQLGVLFVGRSMVLATRARGDRNLGVVGRTVLVDWRLETTERVSKRLGIRVGWGRGSIVVIGDMERLLYRR